MPNLQNHFLFFLIIVVTIDLGLSKLNQDDHNSLMEETCMKTSSGKKKCFLSAKREAEIDRFHVSRVDETFMNPWNLGPPVNWTNSFQGWTQEKRYQLYKLFKTWTQQVIQVQPYTKTGFRRAKIPDDLYKLIKEKMRKEEMVREPAAQKDETFCLMANCRTGHPAMIGVDDEALIIKEIEKSMKPIIEEWSGTEIAPDPTIYGIRRYLKDSWMLVHVDRYPSHILSAILQIDQKVDQEWPLHFQDVNGANYKIFLKPGEMLLYESAKCPHGRPDPLVGEYYDNLFVHFIPKDKVLDGEAVGVNGRFMTGA